MPRRCGYAFIIRRCIRGGKRAKSRKKKAKKRGVSVKRQSVFNRKTVYTTNVEEFGSAYKNDSLYFVQYAYWTK
ncbi:hypothetical protein SUBVAR_04542 [Subdoligranulum variabile DSM 15176]|uniref:Uncharacterized protein n=1 Tax=Subdoligranulum variabile DSM 15176 TaxID=411471 RepID=D1PJH3_9FIRM|nr:hypothetical protein SUBVAR_04542 [Subdoligranulum variabile DSM 15176]